MIGAVVENIIGGYLHPRASVRRLLKAGHGLDAALLMLTLAYLIREIMLLVTPGALPASEGLRLGWYFLGFIGFMAQYGFAVVLVCYVGRTFGGKATLGQTALVLSWYELVTSLIFPLLQTAAQKIAQAMPEPGSEPTEPPALPADLALAVVVGGSVVLWLFAAYVAELHGFKRTLSVLTAVVALLLPLYMALGALVMSA